MDFLSGDYLGNASISAARLDARYLSSVGKPWDLMAWGFQSGGAGGAVGNGGRLLLVGAQNAALFSNELDVRGQ